MRRIVSLAAVSLLGSGMVLATPSVAQVQFGIGPEGPSVRVGPNDEDRYQRRERWRERRAIDRSQAYEEGRRAAWRDSRYGERCRTVTVEEEDEWGRTVVRRMRRC
jgi:hypothetical protein